MSRGEALLEMGPATTFAFPSACHRLSLFFRAPDWAAVFLAVTLLRAESFNDERARAGLRITAATRLSSESDFPFLRQAW